MRFCFSSAELRPQADSLRRGRYSEGGRGGCARLPLACWQPRVSKHSCAGSKNASRSLQTSHVGTARKSRCRSSASMAMAAIEAGDRQEMVPEGLGALLCSLALAADGPFEAAAGQPWQQGFFRADLPPPAHHCDREHGSEPSEAQNLRSVLTVGLTATCRRPQRAHRRHGHPSQP